MLLKVLVKKRSWVELGVLAAVVATQNCGISHAQSDAEVENRTIAELSDRSYGVKFKEAEQALLDGLARSSKVDSDVVLRNASAPVAPVAPRLLNDRVVGVDKKTEEVAKQDSPAPTKISQNIDISSERSRAATLALQGKIASRDKRIQELEQQLSEVRSQLSSAEVEINRLSGVLSSANRARLNPVGSSPGISRNHASEEFTAESASRLSQQPSQRAPRSNNQIATVSVDKADLRLGPGKNHSALMPVRRGSRLMVEVRQGEWYRVFAPNGQRAWIHSSVVDFGAGAAPLNDGSAVRIRGFDSSAEQESFRPLDRATAGTR